LHMTAKSPSLCRVVIFSLAFFDKSFIVGRSLFIELGADDPAAGRSPPFASGDLQLVKKSPNRGYRRGRPDPGRPATAVRFGTHPAPPLVGTRRAKKAAANPVHYIL
jgi:hypothetical protein